jgi:hypothetical protein
MGEAKRNWRGQFLKVMRETPPGSREWLIWSRYHHAWHRRDEEGCAAGYTGDIAQAGIFDREKAASYHDGDRNEALHISDKMPEIEAEIAKLEAAAQRLRAASLRARDGGEGL